MTLAEFFAARVHEDWAVAQNLANATMIMGGKPDFYGTGGPAAEVFWDRFTARRQILLSAADTNLLGLYETALEGGRADVIDALQSVIRERAAAWSGHPDYRKITA
jgi:hypothetical protein